MESSIFSRVGPSVCNLTSVLCTTIYNKHHVKLLGTEERRLRQVQCENLVFCAQIEIHTKELCRKAGKGKTTMQLHPADDPTQDMLHEPELQRNLRQQAEPCPKLADPLFILFISLPPLHAGSRLRKVSSASCRSR